MFYSNLFISRLLEETGFIEEGGKRDKE